MRCWPALNQRRQQLDKSRSVVESSVKSLFKLNNSITIYKFLNWDTCSVLVHNCRFCCPKAVTRISKRKHESQYYLIYMYSDTNFDRPVARRMQGVRCTRAAACYQKILCGVGQASLCLLNTFLTS